MGTCGLVGQIGVYTGWVSLTWPPAPRPPSPPWTGWASILICFILPGVLTWIFGQAERKLGWIKEGDLKLN